MSSDPYLEHDVLLQVAEGDENAFRKLFHHWHQVLAGYVYRITESREVTEEIVQDVFLKIWTIRDSLSEVRNFKSFLFTVSRNHSYYVLKKLAKERGLKDRWKESSAAPEEPFATEWFSVIDEAIETLPARRKEVWLLVRHEALSYHEAAERLGISRESVKTHLKLAAHSIKQFLQKHMNKLAGVIACLVKFF